jgi:hypothetical protein
VEGQMYPWLFRADSLSRVHASGGKFRDRV